MRAFEIIFKEHSIFSMENTFVELFTFAKNILNHCLIESFYDS